ncbi:MAG TPA: hypothetical protein VKH45_05450 [Candidatus Acidoferrum sp.]|nr:hypothetical protein [Candidatus Acidoferrum sp.]
MKVRFLLLLLAMSLCTLLYAAGGITSGSFNFSTFAVPDTPFPGSLGVEHISNSKIIVGYTSPPSLNPTSGFTRHPNGNIVTLQDPLSSGAFQYTLASGVNTQGTVVGYYFDTANDQYSGFFYHGGTFTTYNIPGLPPYSATTILGINEFGAICGYYQAAPAYATVPYVNWWGHIDTNFPIPASVFTEPESVNDLGVVAGSFEDSSKVFHGFIRHLDGTITTVDVPGAAYTGTVLIGINNFGWTSGHFWDSGNHEHGFVRSPKGHFYQIDVPGADTVTPGLGTAGGGLNDEGTVVGHFDPAGGGAEIAYIASPDFDMKNWDE